MCWSHSRARLFATPWNSPAIILEWVAISGDLPNPGTESGSPALQADSLPSALPRIKPVRIEKVETVLCH